jgi:hypothetical protein
MQTEVYRLEIPLAPAQKPFFSFFGHWSDLQSSDL